jgi:glutathione S-transferase
MDHELFWISGSPYGWRVQLALEYKGVPYISRRMDSGKNESRSPAFLALNPRGKVPVLKTGVTALYESVAIIAFLDRAHPAMPLFGQTAQEQGRVWQRVNEFENYTRDLFDVEIVRPLLRGYAKDDPEAMRASAARAYDALGWMEQALSITPYLAGDDITAADIVALPNIQMLRRVAVRPESIEMALGLEDLGSRLPALGGWLSRMEAMRGYDAAYPPHWRS